ncbi:hypothetical protein K8I85_07285 [bacterium]|nr:hypothetical protein [bacterium]
MIPKQLLSLATLAAFVTTAGCWKTDSAPTEPETPPRDFTEPAALIAAHAECLTTMDYGRYAALLSPDFEYVPQENNADDFPWIQSGDGWDLAAELGMIRNMMDPEFVSDETGETVDSMDVSLAVTNERVVDAGIEVTCNADIQVLWTASSGAYARARFIVTLVTDEDGFLRISRIVELPEFNRVDGTSWASIKNLYR